MTTSNFEKVCDFNKTFGLPHYEEEQHDIFNENPKLVKLRYDLIDEEYKELKLAVENRDFKEVIDALADILYVVYGAASSFGFNLDALFRQHYTKSQSNKTNFQNIQASVFPLNVPKNEFENSWWELSEVVDSIIVLGKYLDVLKTSVSNKSFNDFKMMTYKILVETYSLSVIMNIDIQRAFDIVHDSNMSKVCVSEEEAQLTVEHYKANDSRYDTPAYRLSYDNKRYVIYNQSTGKILKNINYVPADFSDMLLG